MTRHLLSIDHSLKVVKLPVKSVVESVENGEKFNMSTKLFPVYVFDQPEKGIISTCIYLTIQKTLN